MSAINKNDQFLIVNKTNNKPLESWPTFFQAQHFCDVLNDHEEKNGRPRIFYIAERED